MNEEITHKLQEQLIGLLEWLDQAAEFVVEQAPLLVQELLTYHTLAGFYYVGGLVLITLLFAGIALGSQLRYDKTGSEGAEILGMTSVIFGLISLTCSIIAGSVWIPIIVKIKYAPRMFLMEYLRETL